MTKGIYLTTLSAHQTTQRKGVIDDVCLSSAVQFIVLFAKHFVTYLITILDAKCGTSPDDGKKDCKAGNKRNTDIKPA